MFRFQKGVSKIIVIMLSLLLVLGCSSTNEVSQQKTENTEDNKIEKAVSRQFSIGTASLGGAYYPVGQEIANLINKYVEEVTVNPEVTGGALENPRLINSGDIEMGLTNSNLAYFGFYGEEPYNEVLNFSAIAPLHPSVLHIITKSDSNINSIEDLKGKKVAVGPAGGGTIPIFTALLEGVGLSMEDIHDTYLSYADGFSQLSDGNVDVALALAGYPTSAVVEASTINEIKFVNVDEELAKQVIMKYPYYSHVVVPKEVYNMAENGGALGVMNVWIVNNDLNEDLVYHMTKAVFDHLDEFIEANANAEQIDPNAVYDSPIPLHPGAKRYFDEVN